MKKPTKAPRDPWRPKKPKKDLRVQFSTWTTKVAKRTFDDWQDEAEKINAKTKPGDTLADVIAFAYVHGFSPAYIPKWKEPAQLSTAKAGPT
jgi:hypothetical protein